MHMLGRPLAKVSPACEHCLCCLPLCVAHLPPSSAYTALRCIDVVSDDLQSHGRASIVLQVSAGHRAEHYMLACDVAIAQNKAIPYLPQRAAAAAAAAVREEMMGGCCWLQELGAIQAHPAGHRHHHSQGYSISSQKGSSSSRRRTEGVCCLVAGAWCKTCTSCWTQQSRPLTSARH